jgi:hypothetical protein
MRFKLLTTLATAALIGQSAAGPIGYGICQTGCSGLVVACRHSRRRRCHAGGHPRLQRRLRRLFRQVRPGRVGSGPVSTSLEILSL